MGMKLKSIAVLLVPALSWADLTNVAQISYLDASGASHTVMSNTVTVTVGPVGSQTLPPPDLSGIDGKVYTERDEIAFPYSQQTTSFQWSIAPDNSFSQQALAVAMSSIIAGSQASTFATPSPKADFSNLNLLPGHYTITVQAADGSLMSSSAQAHITLVLADLSAVRVFPNPWRSGKHDGIEVTFDQLTNTADVKVFTISGHLVKDLGNAIGSAKWDLTNEAGDRVASGVYIYSITNNLGQQTRGKLAVIR
jgi:hypothetical protein